MTASVWNDKRLVYHLSALSSVTQAEVSRRRVGADVLVVEQPHSVLMYNKYRAGVNLHDQMRDEYSVAGMGRRLGCYIVWFLLNSFTVDAFIMYSQVSKRITKKFSHLDVRLELAQELMAGFR